MKKIFLTIAIALASLNCLAVDNQKQPNTETTVEHVEKTSDRSTGRQWKGHEVFQGPKGGLYYWHTVQSGKNAGKQIKRYLSKEEREKFNAGNNAYPHETHQNQPLLRALHQGA